MRTRAFAFVVIASGALMLSQQAFAQVQAPGGVTIYDSTGCVERRQVRQGDGPVQHRDHRPSTELVDLDLRDRQGHPDVVYGPGTFTADQTGNICLDILQAPTGLWKIDVLEQGSGFTDSKVFAIEATETPPIITIVPSTTTTTPGAPTTEATTTTTLPPPTTQPTTTTTLPPPTTQPTSTTTTTTLAPPTSPRVDGPTPVPPTTAAPNSRYSTGHRAGVSCDPTIR